jgi:predicted alpha/beta hydrolase family esterase
VNESIARKQLSRKVEGQKETVVNEYHEFVFDKEIHKELLDEFDEYEMAADNGVYGSMDDDIAFMDITKVCQYLSDRISDAKQEGETEDDFRFERWERLYEYLKKWKGFEIHL